MALEHETQRRVKPVIHQLEPHTINQIAAGEVVERPSSAVKELVENAIDAGARKVTVRIIDYGRKLIEVSDDGCGMDAETIRLALQRHATSKIQKFDDLESVTTLGFRGEALPSIASISKLTLESGIENGIRAQVRVEDGLLSDSEAMAGPQGTTIQVRDIFYNTPARLKFLKSDATELASCVDIVSRLAVAHPEIKFVLTHGTTKLVETSGDGDKLGVLADVWGRESVRALATIDYFNGGARVTGFVSPPHFTKPTRSFQWFFVNGRPLKSRILQLAVDQAYRSITPERRFPLVQLSIDIDPSKIDVNVSPTKSDVRFHSEGLIFDVIKQGITRALLQTGMVPHAEGVAMANAALQQAQSWGTDSPDSNGVPFGQRLQESLALQMPLHLISGTDPSESQLQDHSAFLNCLRILGQVDQTFIVAENATGILIIDQHVAHERIIYEYLRNTRGSAGLEIQPLLSPETLHLDRRSAEQLQEKLGELKSIGFDLEPFGGESFLIRSVPALWRGRSPLMALKDLAQELSEGIGQGCLNTLRDDVYIMCSCKMAIKAGDPLAMPEMERLVSDLAKTENPFLCPHGRPITIVFPKSDLYRRFKRC